MHAPRSRRRISKFCAVTLSAFSAMALGACGSNMLAVKTALDKSPPIAVQFQAPSQSIWGTIAMPAAQSAGKSVHIPVPGEFNEVANAVADGFKEGWGLENVSVVDAATAVTTGLLVQVNVQGNYRYKGGKWLLEMNTLIVIRDAAQGKGLNGFMGDTIAKVVSEEKEIEGVTPSSNPSSVYKESMIPHELLLESLKEATKKGVVDYLTKVKVAKAEG